MVSPPIPQLERYSISPRTGFLPEEPPLTALPNPYYAPWEKTITTLQALLLSKRIRAVIDLLPTLSTDGLQTQPEWRRACVILSFLAHSYIWGGDTPSEVLPQCISVPFLAVTAKLEVPPVASYAALCLWNFRPIFEHESIDVLENLASLHTFTGALDESWFYLVSVALEARGAAILPLMLRAIKAAQDGDTECVILSLQTFAERLDELVSLLMRMHEMCDPHIFYFRIRPYLAGSKNMAEAGLPRGIKYLDGSGQEEFRQYAGGSNAQSSLIQTFDILLGVQHRATGDKRSGAHNDEESKKTDKNNFILEMRQYMPGPHRRFLEDLTKVANIREFVELHSSNRNLTIAYDACLHMLRTFRDKHIQIVSRYIIIPAKEARKNATAPTIPLDGKQSINILKQAQDQYSAPIDVNWPKRQGIARITGKQRDLKGTGGTALIPFLKQARDETGEPSIGAWAHRVLTNGTSSLLSSDGANVKIQGLAGQWLDSEDVGGLCHW